MHPTRIQQNPFSREGVISFFCSVAGHKTYHTDDACVIFWEDFLLHWLKGNDIENLELKMSLFFDTFLENFPYRGPLYRGMQLLESESLRPKTFASFSSCDEVAKYFSGRTSKYGTRKRPSSKQYYLACCSFHALDLHAIMKLVYSRTDNRLLQIEIEDREWEREVIAELTENMLELVVPMTSELEGDIP